MTMAAGTWSCRRRRTSRCTCSRAGCWHLTTRTYLGAAADDAVLESVPADRRATLLAERTDDGYRFDIRIQAHPPERETVFFDV